MDVIYLCSTRFPRNSPASKTPLFYLVAPNRKKDFTCALIRPCPAIGVAVLAIM